MPSLRNPAPHPEQFGPRGWCLFGWFSGEYSLLVEFERRGRYSKRKNRVSSKCKNFSAKIFFALREK
jgi:hypothetical protein